MRENEYRRILGKLDSKGFNPETLFELRRSYPHVRFTVCQTDDLEDHTPYASHGAFHVFLMSSNGHCLSLTQEMQSAVGLILAEA